MNLFKALGNELDYKEILQLDGAFSIAHINYGKSPIFNGTVGKNIAKLSRKNSASSKDRIEDVLGLLVSFNGTEKNYKKADKIQLWEAYWLEYINAFDKMTEILPDSVVTAYVGRHTIEVGLKYLLAKNNEEIPYVHILKDLVNKVSFECNDNYMDDVPCFCELFDHFIEGDNVEYFRFPEYKGNNYFAGNSLDIRWLSYNIALVILKLLHYTNLEDRFSKK
ncbi:MAG: hypothetical protein J6M16_10490 [Clostridia bacterium]|nr:hypothetical protein [Clostridia bacterium]